MSVLGFRRLISATGSCLIAIGLTMTVTAPPASAATVNISIPGGSGPQPVSLLNTGGITFSGAGTATCINFSSIYVVGGTSTWCGTPSGIRALTIDVPRGEGITFGWTTLGGPSDTFSVTLKLAGANVFSGSLTAQSSGTFTQSRSFDTVILQSTGVGDLQITSMSITYSSPSPSSVTDTPPTAPMQGVPLPASGQCSDVVESRLDWAKDISGGWSKSWQSWQVSSGANAPRWEGWACIRTLIWTSRGWVPSSA